MYKFAIDCSSWTGVITPEDAGNIVDAGFAKAIVNLWCDRLRYNAGGMRDDHGKTTVEWQIDSFRTASAEVDGYEYYYFAQTPEGRANYLLSNLNGRLPNFIWLDWEDDETVLTIPDTVAYIHRAQDAHVGVQWTGHYSRREWWLRRTGNSQDFKGQWLWDATNDHTPDLSYNEYGGFQQYMEQYWFDAFVAGKGPLDLNVYWEPEDDQPEVIPDPDPSLFPKLDLTIFDALKSKVDSHWVNVSDFVNRVNTLVTDVSDIRSIMAQLEASK